MTENPPKFGASRRALLLTAGSAVLAGCEAPFGLDYSTIKKVAAVSVGLEDPPGITLEQASQIPYSSLGFRIGKSSEGLLVLASQTGEDFLWTSADRVALVTRNGRIVKTGGLRWNLSTTSFPSIDPLSMTFDGAPVVSPSLRIVDFNDVNRFSVRIKGEFESLGPQTTNILGTDLPTIALIEHCKSDDLDWEFQNAFWRDHESGLVWKSLQFVHPNEPPITIEILRPPE